ncbi:2-succinyl-5-enolpyruvyl-6-hydroxy-3-cyclohexene-1-carboxylic-acid synthase [Erwinia sp. E_sp_B04_7]|uniref:2-succinyl-5-enolpyruvyl-6-hydroxy-3- cyclohexene-1-carboxylic-acid synthase n=1 Tax=unclassified Erwinia TaxID=2622719 RepID=UPI0030CD0111
MSQSTFNRRWAGVVVEALTRHRVAHICIAPGSRSAPLTLAAASHPRLICHTHFDERGLGHLALGLAKSTGQPVAIIVTSGTAVANLYPAVIEARLTGERLIILSADRPAELIDCGANQAIDQQGVFASHAMSLSLPRPTADISARWLVSAIDSLLAQNESGAVQINCPFAEPLYGGDPAAFQAWHAALGSWWQDSQPWLQQMAERATPLHPEWSRWRQRRGVVVAGKITAEEGVAVARWASELGWPLIGDVQSHCGQPLPSATLWLQDPRTLALLFSVEIVVQFGSHLTGKPLSAWLAACQPETFWLIEPMPQRRDPAQHRGCRILAEILPWLAAHPAQVRTDWCPALRTLVAGINAASAARAHSLPDQLPTSGGAFRGQLPALSEAPGAHSSSQQQPVLSEVTLARHLPGFLPASGALFLGNSLTIRLVDAFAQLPAGYPVFANRGASGIDGLIATAAGVQRGLATPLLVVLGDISALYDVNSLALFQSSAAPVVIIVVNNNGGQIFSMLPTPEAERERYFAMPQRVDFAAAAELFGLKFQRPTRWQALTDAIELGWRGGVTLIELQVSEDEGARSLVAAQAGDEGAHRLMAVKAGDA